MENQDAVWSRLLELMPRHDCGRRLVPGGNPAVGCILVCVDCSHIEMPTKEWVDAKVAEAVRLEKAVQIHIQTKETTQCRIFRR